MSILVRSLRSHRDDMICRTTVYISDSSKVSYDLEPDDSAVGDRDWQERRERP